MSNNFSFSATAGTSQSTVKPALKGNDIFDVTFDGVEIKDFEGKKDPTKTFRTLVFKFSNDDGEFQHVIFEPTPDGFGGLSDFARGESEYKDKDGKINKIPQPSVKESIMLMFKHLIDVVNPSVAKAIDSKEKELIAKDWDGIRILVEKILIKGVGTETKIKLINNTKGEPKFPVFFAAVNREGKAYIRNNFIGDKVAFTPYELTRIKNASTAKPTNMDNDDNLLEEEDTSDGLADLDLNFEV